MEMEMALLPTEVQRGSSLAFLWGAASQSLALPSSPMSLLEAGLVPASAHPAGDPPVGGSQLTALSCHKRSPVPSGQASAAACCATAACQPSGWHLCPVNCKVTSRVPSSCCECGLYRYFLASLAQPPLGD